MTSSVELSVLQKTAVLGDGNFLLTACPGSGKTTSIAGRVAQLTREAKSVALLSYTKIGRDELTRSIQDQHGVELSSESYVGTIHSFVSRYLVRPFAHILTGSDLPVRVDQTAALSFDVQGADSRMSHYDLSGQLVASFKPLTPTELDKSRESRQAAAKEGVVNYDDALYWAYRVIREVPEVVSALAQRFDEVIVDEAQDSNEVQLAILRELHDAGLGSLVMVGDFDQTIYAFNGSQPELCKELANDCGLEHRQLTENYRASQVLCNTTAKFRQVKTPDQAVGPYRDLQLNPKVILYDPDNPEQVLTQFSTLIGGCGTTIESSACLARANSLKTLLSGDADMQLPELGKTVLRIAEADVPALLDLRDLEHAVVTRAFGRAARNLDLDELILRGMILDLIERFPSRSGIARDWFGQVDALVDECATWLSPALSSPGPKRRLGGDLDPAIQMDSVLTPTPGKLRIDSIHKTKGESIDAVMVVADWPKADWHTPQASTWAGALSSGSGPSDEELRILYVAITRARKLLVIALPNGTTDWVVDAFKSAGFDHV